MRSATHEVAKQEERVGGTLCQSPHQIRVPLGPKRRGHENLEATPDEVELELRAHAVEELELEAVVADPVLLGEPDSPLEQPLVVRRDRPIAGTRERSLEEAHVRRVDVRLARVGDLGRLEVGALDEPEVRGEREQRLEIAFAAVENRTCATQRRR